MKKTLLSLSLLFALGSAVAQTTVYSYGFDGTTADLETAGWMRTNQGTPATATLWTVASYTPVVVTPTTQDLPFNNANTPVGQTGPVPNGQAGGQNSFALVNFTSTGNTNPVTGAITGSGTISNWLITPVVTVQNGDVVSFYTRIGKDVSAEDPNASFADRLQLRMSSNGAATTNPSGGSAGLGDFTTLLVDVNPNLNLTDYPTDWGQFTATISGLSGPTDVKFAFRYFVTSGGPSGDNSDIIGIDTFNVARPVAGTDDFFRNTFTMFPNPAKDVLNISANDAVAMNTITVTDINGRTVKQQNIAGVSSTQVNVTDLNTGMYFISIETEQGKGTAKFMKN